MPFWMRPDSMITRPEIEGDDMPTQVIWRKIHPWGDEPPLAECPACGAAVADALRHADWHAYEVTRVLRVTEGRW